jgi:hypothetical protein
MQNMANSNVVVRSEDSNVTVLPPYETPSIRVMDEKEVLSSFQVTVASITWWVM